MRYTTIILSMLISVSVFAQKVTHELNNFSELRVSNGIHLILKQGKENRAVVTGESRGEVRFKVEAGILKVKLGLDNIWDEDDDTRVELFYTDLDKISARQNASIRVEGRIKQKRLKMEAQEGSRIFTEIKVEQLHSECLTGGLIEASGKALNQEVDVKAGGQYYAKNLESQNVDISISAGGVADINASKKVDAKVRAGGTVNVYGNPQIIDKNTFLGGKVVRKN